MIPPVRPEVTARLAREQLGLGLVERCADILQSIEDEAGVPVGVLALPEGFAGVMKRARGRAFIFINGTEAVVRRRFTLAHEFGHYWLDHGTVFDRTADMNGRDPQEVAANAFAGEFLMPRQAVHAWMERRGDPSVDLEVVVRLAAHFGVSATVARIRLQNAGLLARPRRIEEAIQHGQHRSLHLRLQLAEVQDTLTAITALPRLPRAMQQNAVRIYESGLLDIAQIAERTSQAPEVVSTQMADITPTEDDPDF